MKEIKDQEIEVKVKDTAELQELLTESVKQAVSTEKRYAEKFNFGNDVANKAKRAKAEDIADSVKLVNALFKGDLQTAHEIHAKRAEVLVRTKALSEGTDSAGGYLVPTEFERMVNKAMDQYSEVRSKAKVLRMTSNVKDLNELTSKVTVYKVAELTKNTASQPTFGEPVLTTEKYMGSTTMSEELLEDGEVDVVKELTEQFAEQLAKKEQDSFINSTVSGSEGLLQVSGVTNVDMSSGNTAFTDITFDDLADMQKEAFDYSKSESQNGVYFMSMVAYNALRKSKGTDNHYILPPVPTKDMPAMAWGRPIIVINEMPTTTATSTKFVIYSDLSKHLFIGDRVGLKFRMNTQGTSADGTNLNTQDARELVLRKRTAQVTSLESGIITLTTAAS